MNLHLMYSLLVYYNTFNFNTSILLFSAQGGKKTVMAAELEVELEGNNEYPAHYKVMLDKLNEQRQLDQFTDITLIVDGEKAYVIGHL